VPHGTEEPSRWVLRWSRLIAPGGAVLDLLLDLADNMTGKTICVLSDSCAAPVVSGIRKFRSEFEDYLSGKTKPRVAA